MIWVVGRSEDGVAAPVDDTTASSIAHAQPALERLRGRRRRARLLFVAGLAVIVVPGFWWAAATQDPIRGAGNRPAGGVGPFGPEFGFEEGGFFDDGEFFGDFPAVATTIGPFEG